MMGLLLLLELMYLLLLRLLEHFLSFCVFTSPFTPFPVGKRVRVLDDDRGLATRFDEASDWYAMS